MGDGMTESERRLQLLVWPHNEPQWKQYVIDSVRQAAHEHYELMYACEHGLIENEEILYASEKL